MTHLHQSQEFSDTYSVLIGQFWTPFMPVFYKNSMNNENIGQNPESFYSSYVEFFVKNRYEWYCSRYEEKNPLLRCRCVIPSHSLEGKKSLILNDTLSLYKVTLYKYDQ